MVGQRGSSVGQCRVGAKFVMSGEEDFINDVYNVFIKIPYFTHSKMEVGGGGGGRRRNKKKIITSTERIKWG